MDAFFESLPEILKAATTSGLGTLALLAVILGLLAWRFFRAAPPGWRFAAFALLYFGVAGYAAALFVQAPSVIERADGAEAASDPGNSADGQRQAEPTKLQSCRLPQNGVERYGQETRIPLDSGWKEGGSNPHDWCSARVVEQQRQYPDRRIFYEDPGERSRERLRHFTYRYTCTLVEQWDPIYNLAEHASCP